MKFTENQLQELEDLDVSMFHQMAKAKGTKLDAMYRFWIGEMTWQEQMDEISRVLSLEKIFPDRIAKSDILNRYFKVVRFR